MILAPEGTPEWAKDRAQLWNQVEAAEVRKDAQLAREMDIALPVELTYEQRRDLIKGFVQEQFVQRGMVADVSIHQGVGEFKPNPHAHVMLTMREIHEEGFGNKVREWNDRALLGGWRVQWERAANQELEKAGHEARIDHRSLEDQREAALSKEQYERAIELDRAPTHHRGVIATNIHREGRESEVLARMKKDRQKETNLYLKERKELTGLVQELRDVQGQREREPGNQKFTEVQRQADVQRSKEEERKTSEQQALERARTDRGLLISMVETWNQDALMAYKRHEPEAQKAIIERQKPQHQKLREMATEYRSLGQQRDFIESESKKLINIFRRGEFEQDIANIDQERRKIESQHTALNEQLKNELGPDKVQKEAERITWEREPKLFERMQALEQIIGEWRQRDQAQKQKQLEQQQKKKDLGDEGRGGLPGFKRGDPEIEL
jgi:hypothetical protein